MTTAETERGSEVDQSTVRRAVMASAMGNAVEWYDYGVFTSGALTVAVGSQFFPGDENSVLKSLALVAAGFIVRPLGGVVFGPLGDKLGRQRVLAATILLMSGCTFLVGVLPTYAGPYSFGIGASLMVLALRIVQGFSTGGEYGGAATFIAEYAPTARRGFFGSFLEFGTLSGYVLGNAVVLATVFSLDADSMASWGWRLPFLLALPLGLIGLYLRTKLEDTPEFHKLLERDGNPQKAPLRETLVQHWRMILNLFGIVFLLSVADYMLLTTMPSYLQEHLDLDDTAAGGIIVFVEIVQILVIVPLGALSDRIGRKPLLITSALGFIFLSYPSLQAMQTGNIAFLLAGFLTMAFLLVLMLAVIGSTFPAMFPTRVRYGAFAIGYNISVSLFGGTCGALVEFLIQMTGDNDIPAYYLILAGVIGIIPILKIPETARVPLDSIGR
ncbi:MFS transporter [Salinifilum ghardaiensis]